MFSRLFLISALLGWSFILCAKESPAPLRGLTAKQLVEYDQVEWRTIVFQKSLPKPVPIPSIQKAIEGRTTIRMHPKQQWISYQPQQFHRYPFLHLEMCQYPPPLPLQDKLHWRDFFNAGGTLYLDACHPTREKTEAWKQWGQSIYPETKWEAMNNSHVLSFSFYLLEKRMLLSRGGTPIYLLENDGRFIIIFNQSPQWSWKQFKQSKVSRLPNARATEIQLRFHINLFMYLLTGHYKSDQLHLPTILLRRK